MGVTKEESTTKMFDLKRFLTFLGVSSGGPNNRVLVSSVRLPRLLVGREPFGETFFESFGVAGGVFRTVKMPPSLDLTGTLD